MSNLLAERYKGLSLFNKVTQLSVKVLEPYYDEEGNQIFDSDEDEMSNSEYDDEVFDGIFNADRIDYETWDREAAEEELKEMEEMKQINMNQKEL